MRDSYLVFDGNVSILLNLHVLETIPTQTEIKVVQQKIGILQRQTVQQKCFPIEIGIHCINKRGRVFFPERNMNFPTEVFKSRNIESQATSIGTNCNNDDMNHGHHLPAMEGWELGLLALAGGTRTCMDDRDVDSTAQMWHYWHKNPNKWHVFNFAHVFTSTIWSFFW